MLVNFTFDNFQSFRDEQEFSMIAGRIREDRESCFPVAGMPGMRLLPVTAIYGGNASGKSTFVRALHWLQTAVTDGKTTATPFALESETIDQPTKCSVVMLIHGRMWEYSLSMRMRQVVEESLCRVEKEKESLVFKRIPGKGNFELGNTVKLKKATRQYTVQLGKTLPGEKVFLSMVMELAIPEISEFLRPIYHWLTQTLCVVRASHIRRRIGRDLSKNPELYSQALRKADTGITQLLPVPVPLEEANVPREILESFQTSEEKEIFSDTGAYQLKKENGGIKAYRWSSIHQSKNENHRAIFSFDCESDGTMRYLDLLPIVLEESDEERVYVIDELDRSLHPKLTQMLLRKHLEQARNGTRRQLVFTTHDVQLMEEDLLRNDEYWFVEKERDGSTNLYPLSDFRFRKELNLRKGYMEGRFGATPRLLDIEIANA